MIEREMEEEEFGGVEIERGLGKRQRKGGRATKIDFKCLVVCNVCMYVMIFNLSPTQKTCLFTNIFKLVL